jgi:hypothetical protein
MKESLVSLLDIATTVENKMLAVIGAGQRAMVSVVRACTDTVGKVIPASLGQSFADQAGKLSEVVDSAYGLTENSLGSQRQWVTSGWVQPMATLFFRTLPKLSGVIDNTVDFSAKLVASQRSFAKEFVQATIPAAKAEPAPETKPAARIQPLAQTKPAARIQPLAQTKPTAKPKPKPKPTTRIPPAAEAKPTAAIQPKTTEPEPKIAATQGTA